MISIYKKIIKLLTKKGKKTKAVVIINKVFFLMRKRRNTNPFLIFQIAVNNAIPAVELFKLKKGNTVFFIPRLTSKNRRESLVLRWFLLYVQKQKNKSFVEALEQILFETAIGQGEVINFKKSVHEKAELSKNNF